VETSYADRINALLQNQTWTLVPPQQATNLVGCKWVFKVKRKADGSIERHKDHLVDKGFHQQVGLDYGETFSPIVKPTTIRTVYLWLTLTDGTCVKLTFKTLFYMVLSMKKSICLSHPVSLIQVDQIMFVNYKKPSMA